MVAEVVTSENRDAYMKQKLGIEDDSDKPNKPTKHLYHIPIEHIEHGESAMPGGKLTWANAKQKIKDYSERKTELPPIAVTSNWLSDEGETPENINGKPMMIYDGSHRYEAAKLRKMTHIPAYLSEHDKEGIEYANKHFKKVTKKSEK
jgi:hypothetical protein